STPWSSSSPSCRSGSGAARSCAKWPGSSSRSSDRKQPRRRCHKAEGRGAWSVVGANLEVAAEGPRQFVKTRDEAFEALFKSEYARVAGIANRVLADPQEAEDVAQEVFISFHRLHSASAQFAPAWLHRAAAHTALNRVRGRKRRERRELAQAPEEASRTVD